MLEGLCMGDAVRFMHEPGIVKDRHSGAVLRT